MTTAIVAWTDETSGGTPHAVRALSPNGWGLNDMRSNVKEWTGDWYDGGIYERGDSADPVGTRGSGRVTRGGSRGFHLRSARVAARGRITPHDPDRYLRFRLARTSP
jgi:sulfatase modifying factor 1